MVPYFVSANCSLNFGHNHFGGLELQWKWCLFQQLVCGKGKGKLVKNASVFGLFISFSQRFNIGPYKLPDLGPMFNLTQIIKLKIIYKFSKSWIFYTSFLLWLKDLNWKETHPATMNPFWKCHITSELSYFFKCKKGIKM